MAVGAESGGAAARYLAEETRHLLLEVADLGCRVRIGADRRPVVPWRRCEGGSCLLLTVDCGPCLRRHHVGRRRRLAEGDGRALLGGEGHLRLAVFGKRDRPARRGSPAPARRSARSAANARSAAASLGCGWRGRGGSGAHRAPLRLALRGRSRGGRRLLGADRLRVAAEARATGAAQRESARRPQTLRPDAAAAVAVAPAAGEVAAVVPPRSAHRWAAGRQRAWRAWAAAAGERRSGSARSPARRRHRTGRRSG